MICSYCGKDKPDVERRRRSTAYENDELNFITICLECYQIEEALWQEQWEEYWRGCI